MHIKEVFTIALIVFAIVLILDKDGAVKSALGDSLTSKASVTGDVASSAVDIAESDLNEDLVKEAEKYQHEGDRQLAVALKDVEDKDWQGCVNQCISARNNYDRSTDKFKLVVNDLEDLREKKSGRVFQAFIDTSVNYYSCSDEASSLGMSACEALEDACLKNSQSDGSGSGQMDEANQKLAELNEKRDSCNALLSQ